MDFPYAHYHRQVISSVAFEAVCVDDMRGFAGGSATWPSANTALLVPLRINAPYMVKKLWWGNGATATGNVDCGVYSLGGALLTSAGTTAQAGTSVVQSVSLGTPYLLSPGSYYLALVASTTSATFFRLGITQIQGQMVGMAQAASAGPALPSSLTVASYATSYLPIFGIARAGTI